MVWKGGSDSVQSATEGSQSSQRVETLTDSQSSSDPQTADEATATQTADCGKPGRTSQKFRSESKKYSDFKCQEERDKTRPDQQLCHRVPNAVLARAEASTSDPEIKEELKRFNYSKDNVVRSTQNHVHSTMEREMGFHARGSKEEPTAAHFDREADRVETSLLNARDNDNMQDKTIACVVSQLTKESQHGAAAVASLDKRNFRDFPDTKQAIQHARDEVAAREERHRRLEQETREREAREQEQCRRMEQEQRVRRERAAREQEQRHRMEEEQRARHEREAREHEQLRRMEEEQRARREREAREQEQRRRMEEEQRRRMEEERREQEQRRRMEEEREEQRRREVEDSLRHCEHFGVHQSSGSANGRELFVGPRGGVFYMSSGGNKVYQ